MAGIVAAVLAVSAVAYAMGTSGPSAHSRRVASPVFRVRGHVAGLYPGRHGTMKLKIRNSYRFPISVRRVVAHAASPAAGCPGGTVVIRPWRGHLRVPSRSRRRITVRVKMRVGASSACIGARYPITYTGKAVRA